MFVQNGRFAQCKRGLSRIGRFYRRPGTSVRKAADEATGAFWSATTTCQPTQSIDCRYDTDAVIRVSCRHYVQGCVPIVYSLLFDFTL